MLMAAEWGTGQVLWSMLWFFLWFIWIWLLIMVFSDIFRSPDLGGGGKTLWVIFVIIIPWLGILTYLIARGHGMHERQLQQAAQVQAAQAEYIRSVAGSPSGDVSSQIAKGKDLLDRGAITQTEFDQIKAKALAS